MLRTKIEVGTLLAVAAIATVGAGVVSSQVVEGYLDPDTKPWKKVCAKVMGTFMLAGGIAFAALELDTFIVGGARLMSKAK